MKKMLALIALSLSALSFAMQQNSNEHVTKVMTYNVCHPFQIYNDQKTKNKLAWKKREPQLLKLIQDEDPDIIGFQELRNVEEEAPDAVGNFLHNLSKIGYEYTKLKSNVSPASFVNVIAYKEKKFFLENTYRWWTSQTPEVMSSYRSNGWPQVTLMATLRPIIYAAQGWRMAYQIDPNCLPLHIVNLHNSIQHDERMFANKLLVRKIAEHTKNQEGLVIISGDFNSFSTNEQGKKELEILEEAGYEDITKNLQTADGIKVSGTFISYSFDPCRRMKLYKEPTKFGDHLDHIFVKNISPNKQSYITSCHVNAKKYTDFELTDKHPTKKKTEKDFLSGVWGKDERNEFPSDHVPVIGTINIKKDT